MAMSQTTLHWRATGSCGTCRIVAGPDLVSVALICVDATQEVGPATGAHPGLPLTQYVALWPSSTKLNQHLAAEDTACAGLSQVHVIGK